MNVGSGLMISDGTCTWCGVRPIRSPNELCSRSFPNELEQIDSETHRHFPPCSGIIVDVDPGQK